MDNSIFLELGIMTIAAAALGVIARLWKQPIVLAYIATGILLGAGGLHLVTNTVQTEDIAKVGILFLLFLIGMELDVGQIRRVGKVVLAAGIFQTVAVTAAAYVFAVWLHYSTVTALYLGLAASFSSTAVVMKRLIDRRELASLSGRVTAGILLLQDIMAVMLLIVINGIDGGPFNAAVLGNFLIKGTLFLGLIWLVTRYLLARVFAYIAKSTELLFLASIAWAFLFAIVCELLGFSREIGAFVAGLSLATLPYSLEVSSRVRVLKDFFLVVFFVVLGLEISWPLIGAHLPLVIGLAAIALFMKTFVVSATMVRFGYPKRPSYLTGANLGQTSEFSLLVVLLAASLGQVPKETVGIMAAVLVLTIVLNTYWVSLNRYFYPILVIPLNWIGNRVRDPDLSRRPEPVRDQVLMFGANRMGYGILKSLERHGAEVRVVDHDPMVIKRLRPRGVETVYGDVNDVELLREVGLDDARMIISTVPNQSANRYLIERTRTENKNAIIVVMAEQVDSALELYDAGADYVIVPHLLGGERVASMIEDVEWSAVTKRDIRKSRSAHIRHLKRSRAELRA